MQIKSPFRVRFPSQLDQGLVSALDAILIVPPAVLHAGVGRRVSRFVPVAKYASQFPLQRSFLASQKIQPVPGAMRFAHCVAQIAVQAGFAAELLPPKAVAHKAKATIAHVASTFTSML